MTKVLRDVVGVRISRITDTVEARLADPETARLLQVPLLSPILHYTGVTYDDGRPGGRRGADPLPGRPLLVHGDALDAPLTMRTAHWRRSTRR